MLFGLAPLSSIATPTAPLNAIGLQARVQLPGVTPAVPPIVAPSTPSVTRIPEPRFPYPGDPSGSGPIRFPSMVFAVANDPDSRIPSPELPEITFRAPA